MSRTAWLLVLFAAGCSDPGHKPQSGGSGTVDSTHSDGGSEDSGSGAGSTGGTGDDGGSGGSGDGGSGSGDGGGDGGSDGGTTEPVRTLVPLPSAVVLEEADEGGRLTARCALFEDDVLVSIVDEIAPSIAPLDGVTEEVDGWAFEAYGTRTVTCAGEVEDTALSGSVDVQVVNEAIAKELSAVGRAGSAVELATVDWLAANGGADAALVDAVHALEAAAELGWSAAEDDGLDDALRNMPSGWPEPETLTAQGIARTADDDALGPALTAMGTALSALEAAWAGIDPEALTDADIDALAAHTASVQATGDALLALSPTAHGFIEHRTALATELARPVARVQAQMAQTQAEVLRVAAADVFEADTGTPPPPFGLVGAVVGMGNYSRVQSFVINRYYMPVIEQLDLSINNLILMELIDYLAPAGVGGPEIMWVENTSSTAWVQPGRDTVIYGSGFAEQAGYNLFVIVGVSWQEVVDEVFDMCGIDSKEDTVVDMADSLDDCRETFEDAVENSVAEPTGVATDDVWGQAVSIGPLPDVCGSGWVPVTIGLLPINLATGTRGEFFQVNCLP